MEYKSKTQRKKEALSLQALGEKLVKLSVQQIKDLDLPVEISEAVVFAKTLKNHEALRRQMQYIGVVMRKIDTAPIRETVHDIEMGDYKKAEAFKETEKCRDELIAGNTKLMEEILKKCPDADRRQLSSLVRNAVKERANNKPHRAFRALFRYLIKIGAAAV